MTVFVEYAFLDNFTMDCLLLFCSAVTLKIRFRWWRVALGAFVGTVGALLTVFVRNAALLYLSKACCLLLMCLVVVGFNKKLFWYILLTLAYTFVTGGAIVGIFNLLNVDYAQGDGFFYNTPVPLFVYFLAVAVTVFLCYSLAMFVKQTKRIAPYLKKVRVTLDKTYDVTGFCDSGNTVTCEDLPVCFVTKKFGALPRYFADNVLRGAAKKVQVATLTGSQTVTAVKARLEVEGKSYDVFLALPASKCQTQYELVLSNEFVGGEK